MLVLEKDESAIRLASGNPDIAHVVDRLEGAALRARPFSHFVADGVLPADLSRALPGALEVVRRAMQRRHDTPPDDNSLPVGEVPGFAARCGDRQTRETLARFGRILCSPDLYEALFAAFLPHVGQSPTCLGMSVSRVAEVDVRFRFGRSRPDFTVGTGAPEHILTGYLFPDVAAPQNRLTFHTPRDRKLRCIGLREHPADTFREVANFPAAGNALVAFVNSETSFHAIQPGEESTRPTPYVEYIARLVVA